MKRIFKNNGLSIVLLVCFLAFWAAQAVSGFKVHNQDQILYGRSPLEFLDYLRSGHFWQATGENWESEFLQMGAYVILTTYLYQRGSAESNDPNRAGEFERERKKKPGSWLYRNSLSLAFLVLFLLSFTMHAAGGLVEFNEERSEHGQSAATLGEFLGDPEFWFQSFQNWQSEFLAVLSIVVLTIFLRQNGSPESKKVGATNSETGD